MQFETLGGSVCSLEDVTQACSPRSVRRDPSFDPFNPDELVNSGGSGCGSGGGGTCDNCNDCLGGECA